MNGDGDRWDASFLTIEKDRFDGVVIRAEPAFDATGPGGLGEVVSTSGYVDLVARCRVAHLVHIVGTAKMPSNAETAGAPVALACRAT